MARGAAGRLRLEPDLGASVGGRLREQRRELGLTLSEAARAAGISVSYLSSIEIGNSIPSLPILARVVGALGLSLNEVLRNVGQTVVNAGRLDAAAPGVHPASHEDLLLDVAFVVSEPGERGECPVTSAGHEVFVYVLEGVVEVSVDGEPYELQAGDSLDAESAGRLEFRAGDERRTVAVWASIADGRGGRGAPRTGR